MKQSNARLWDIRGPEVITGPFRFRKSYSLVTTTVWSIHTWFYSSAMEGLSQTVTQLHGINGVPSGVGTPAFGESLWPECIAGSNHLTIRWPSGEAGTVTHCVDFPGRTMIKDQNEYPAKACLFRWENSGSHGFRCEDYIWKGSKSCGKSAFSNNHCTHSEKGVVRVSGGTLPVTPPWVPDFPWCPPVKTQPCSLSRCVMWVVQERQREQA